MVRENAGRAHEVEQGLEALGSTPPGTEDERRPACPLACVDADAATP
eukprot:SAG11_NODE_1627_length_4552_cov_4.548619_5_plen_47_part_00